MMNLFEWYCSSRYYMENEGYFQMLPDILLFAV